MGELQNNTRGTNKMYNFGKSVNKVVIPEMSEVIILDSVKDAYKGYIENQNTQVMESLDFYYNQNLDVHLEQWFASDSLQQVPPFVQSCVPRFAKARMMLYKENPMRLISGEVNDDYNDATYKLNTTTKEFAELTWLLGCCWVKSRYNERKNRHNNKYTDVTQIDSLKQEIMDIGWELDSMTLKYEHNWTFKD